MQPTCGLIRAASDMRSCFQHRDHRQVRHAISALRQHLDVILDRNYTGDILNFGLAKEQYAAAHPEKADRVKFVIVGDDVAVGKTQGKIVGRRYVLDSNRIKLLKYVDS